MLVVQELRPFFIAIARSVLNTDGVSGTALHPVVWSAAAKAHLRRKHLLLNPDTNARKEKEKDIQKKKRKEKEKKKKRKRMKKRRRKKKGECTPRDGLKN